MTKTAKIGLAALLVSLAAGCASVTYSSSDKLDGIALKGVRDAESRQLVLIETSGYYLFWTIPLASGDLRWSDEKKSIKGGTSLFRDQVGITEIQEALLKIAETRNCDLGEVYYNDSDSTYAGISYTGLLGMFFGQSQMSASAVLVPRESAK